MGIRIVFKWTAVTAAVCITGLIVQTSYTDTLELVDGTLIQNCYVRDEGIRLLVWEKLADVGGPSKIYPRSQVKTYKIERGEDWDVKPKLPDLSVTFIEMNPKLAGLHGRVNYDKYGRPSLGGGSKIPDLGERAFMEPEEAAKNLKLQYTPGEEITLTAHVKNVGFADAAPFEVQWLIDDKEIKRDRHTRTLKEMQEAAFELKWKWQEGFHHVTVKVITRQPEIAVINNEATDPLWGLGLVYIVHPGRINAWHQARTAYGTFCFEDFYRWHIDIMNTLFKASIFPSAPDGIRARVRLDRIIYAEDVEKAARERVSADGIAYDQGAWIWIDDQDRNKKWEPASKEWRNQTEWSLPHELGHQLGLVDYYALDYAGHEYHVMPDNGEKITHFMTHPMTMMHWHGPHIWSELDAGYMNMTYNKPRGHFGDYYFAIPRENYLRVVDVNGQGVPGAKVEIFQRGVIVDPNGVTGEDQGVQYFPAVEDGDFGHPISKEPVIVGTTDSAGMLRLPNRPVQEVRTLNGFHRQPNPFGNLNVVGQRGLMLAKITKYDRPCYYFLEIYQFNIAWFRGQKERFEMVLKAPYRSESSPLPPRSVQVTRIDEHHVKVTWDAPEVPREQQYLDKMIGFRVYRRVSADGLNDRPWFPVGTVEPGTRELTVDLRQFPQDTYWYSRVNRFAVSTIGELGIESELVEIVMPSN